MNYDFEYMKSIALNPFARPGTCVSLQSMGEQRRSDAISLTPDVARHIANGTWSEAECCCDPGPDQFPEMEAFSNSEGSN